MSRATNQYIDDLNITFLDISPIFIIATGALILICYLKGEKPQWQWNGKKIKGHLFKRWPKS
jgi:hypothetical protein